MVFKHISTQGNISKSGNLLQICLEIHKPGENGGGGSEIPDISYAILGNEVIDAIPCSKDLRKIKLKITPLTLRFLLLALEPRILYGQPKIQKINVPMRPILSAIEMLD